MDKTTLLVNTEVQNQGYLCSFFDLAVKAKAPAKKEKKIHGLRG